MRRISRAAGAVALVLVVAACASPVGSATSPSPDGTAAASGAATTPGQAPTLTPGASTPAVPGGSLDAPTPAGAVVEDPSLLAVLPADLGGIVVAHEPQAFADAAGDEAFASNVQSAAFAVAVDGESLASAVVARLNPDTYTDAFFRDWRDSYNEGACGQAGGLVGNAESQLGEQTVYIGSCAGGLLTYHAWVESRGVIVSAFSLGDGKLGELLMAGLRP